MVNELCWILAAFAAAFTWSYLSWRFSPLWKIPGPIRKFTLRNFLIGVFTTVEKESFMEPHKRWIKDAGPGTKMLHYTGIFGKHFICVLDADGVKKILTSKAGAPRPQFVKGLYYLKKVIGDGLITLDGEHWQRHRSIVQPSFNTQVLKEALDSCVPNLVDRVISAWKQRVGSDIELPSHFSALTLDIIGKVGFSHDFKSVDSMEQWARDVSCDEVELKDPLIRGLYASLMPSLKKMVLVNLRLSFLEKHLISQTQKTQAILNQTVQKVVERARERYKSRVETSRKAKFLLELMFEAEDREPGSRSKSLTHEELQEEIKTFLVAGHETTSTLCVWACYCLIKHPDKQKLVLEEIMEHANRGQITMEAVDKMSYLDAFLSEVLRLYPPVGMILRNTGAEWVDILGEKIPPHTRVMIPIYLLHRNPEYWSSPEEFMPERWLDGGQKCSHHFAYLPFSAGGRNCIGQRFALWEAKLILAPIIREFEMTLSPSSDVADRKLVSFITIKSIPTLKMRVKPRT